MTRAYSPFFLLLRQRSLLGFLLLTACGGRTDIEDWNDFSVPFEPGAESGGVLNPVGGGPAGGGTPNTGGAPVIGAGGSGGTGATGGSGGIGATGGAGGTGATGGAGGTGGIDGTGGSGGSITSVMGDVFVDCETNIENGDGFSWATPLKHPALAFPGREDGDVIYLKTGTCHAWNDPSVPLLTIPDGLSVTLAGGYDGDNLNDPFAHAGGKTVFSGDNNEDDIDLPGTLSTSPEFLESRSDNSSTIVSVGENADVLMTNLEISGAFDYTGTSEEFGCIAVGQDALFTAAGTTIRNCAAVYSAALRAAPGSSVLLSQVLVEHNQTFGQNGVVTASEASLFVYEQSEFRANRAIYGGAIALRESSLEVSGALFEDNHVPALGGAIHLGGASSTATLQDVTFESNTASSGGAIANTGGSLTAITCQFLDNSASNYAGSILVDVGDLTLLESRFEGGSAVGGGELALWNADQLMLDSNFFWNATAELGGTILVTNSAGLSIFTSRFLNGSAQYGGQIMAGSTPLTIENSLFLGGDASGGGALYTDNGQLTVRNSAFLGATGFENGSTIVALDTTFLLDANTFVDNGSPAVPLIGVFGSPDGVVSRCVFRDNVGQGVLRPTATRIYLADSYIGTHTSASQGALVVGTGGTLTTRGLTLAENTTDGVSTPAISVQGEGSTLSLQNAVIWGSESAPEPWISLETNQSTVSVTSSCGPAELATYGTSTTLTSSPFANLPPQIPLFQATSSPCIDQGTDAGQDYSTVSVVTPFSADEGAVDPGYHFAAATPIAGELLLSPTQATWDIEMENCWLVVPSEGIFVGAGPSGTYDHSFPLATEFWLVCSYFGGDAPPVVLKAVL